MQIGEDHRYPLHRWHAPLKWITGWAAWGSSLFADTAQVVRNFFTRTQDASDNLPSEVGMAVTISFLRFWWCDSPYACVMHTCTCDIWHGRYDIIYDHEPWRLIHHYLSLMVIDTRLTVWATQTRPFCWEHIPASRHWQHEVGHQRLPTNQPKMMSHQPAIIDDQYIIINHDQPTITSVPIGGRKNRKHQLNQ